MKKIFILIAIINIISCFEYIIQAGIKSEGYCERSGLIFFYQNCYFVNDLVPSFKDEFSLLIKDNYIAKCKINQKNFISSDFEILCEIGNYFGCMEGSHHNQDLLVIKACPVFINEGDILSFRGFSDHIDNIDGTKTNINCPRELNLKEPKDNEIKIEAKYIIEKSVENYLENSTFYFIINVTRNEDIYQESLESDYFRLNFTNISNQNNESFSSLCHFKDIEKFECNYTTNNISKNFSKNNDIKIISDPELINNLNSEENTYSFSNFINLTTYTIIASKLQKRELIGKDYRFRILNCKSPYISELNKTIYLNILINDTVYETGECMLQNKTNYAMNCNIINISYIPFDIIFPKNTIETNFSIFNDTTTFFVNFDGKRTLTVKPGFLNQGKCDTIEDNTKVYKFNITDCEYHDTNKKSVNFNLSLNFEGEQKNANCLIDLSENNNPISCSLKDYCPNPNSIIIKANPSNDYYTLGNDITLIFEEFRNLKMINIQMKEEGKILITNFSENNCQFIITNNTVLNGIINEELSVDLNINNPGTFAKCSIPSVEKDENFNITCTIDSFQVNDVIEIMEEPFYAKYYFIGYKNKKALTLNAGNIDKIYEFENEFYIRNNNFNGDISKFNYGEINFILDVKIKDNINKKTTCDFNMNDIKDNHIDILCSTEISEDEEINIEYVSVENAESIKLDENTTLNFNNFNKLKYYSLTLGNIIKKDCSNDDNSDYLFYFQGLKIPSDVTISEDIILNITVYTKNDTLKYESLPICVIESEQTIYNMNCTIENYCPIGVFDIIYEPETDVLFNNYLTIYIKNSKISTTTIKPGNLLKNSCGNGYYNFSIENNKFNDFDTETYLELNGKFNLKLKEFTNDAKCKISIIIYEDDDDYDINIDCSVEYNKNESEYCTNMNKDITIEKIGYKDYHYILIKDNAVLHLSSFENLATYTIEGGDLIRGVCKDGNYEFKLLDSKIYNNLTIDDEINFGLLLSQPDEIDALTATCHIPNNLRIDNKFDINCTLTDSSDFCNVNSVKTEIFTIIKDPSEIKDKQINFINFINKTTLTMINAGILYKSKYEQSNNIYYFTIENSTNTSVIKNNINFNLQVKFDSGFKTADCTLYSATLKIECSIKEIDTEDININIEQEPPLDTMSSSEKIINFTNFKSKQINTIIAGKIQKGSCNDGVYSFSFINSKIINDFNGEFILELSQPKKNATCLIKNFDEKEKECDVVCSLEKSESCQDDYEKIEFIVGNKNPENITVNNDRVIYFANFTEQTTIVYNITVGNLLKSEIKNDKFYFTFSNGTQNKFPNFKKTIKFTFDMFYNETQIAPECSLAKISGSGIYSIVTLDCYFNLEEEIKGRDDLLNYDIRIGQDINKNKVIINSKQEINLFGFDNKQTLTLLGKNIINKYMENGKINFVVNYTSSKEIEGNTYFDLGFYKNNDKDKYKANCTFNMDLKTIKCEDLDNTLTIDDDIAIRTNPKYSLLTIQTLYFNNFKSLGTYTVKAGSIVKLECDDSSDSYTFNLRKSSSQNIPKAAFVRIPINLDDNKYNANCSIINSNEYKMDCIINEKVECPRNIILDDDIIKPDETVFEPNTTFFNDFNNKRTITITAGRLKKGVCDTMNNIYNFTFENNILDYKINSTIEFELIIKLENENKTSNCKINLSNENNIIYCEVYKCPALGEDVFIVANPEPNYKSLYPNSLFFENFPASNTTTILTSETSVIIKYEDSFIITDNYINGTIFEPFNIFMKVKLNNEIKEVNCLIPKINKKEKFNISCTISNSLDYDIEITEEPENDKYYFSGYKNKRTLTLKAGSLYKEGNYKNKFDILNCKFSGQYPSIKNFKFNLTCKYDNTEIEDTPCSFDTTGMTPDSNNITIKCEAKNQINDLQIISILNEPDYILMNENITLYLSDFVNLNLYTLTPGNIIKGKCISNYYSFELIDTNISNSLSDSKYINIPLIINENNMEANCQLINGKTNFNMSCKISKYCPIDMNIDIKIETIQKSDINIISPNTLYINIPSEKQTSTLNVGYLIKNNCIDGNFSFNVNNNIYNGKYLEKQIGSFELQLSQFTNNATCNLNYLNINCYIKLDSDEEKSKYCTNIYEDIKVEKLIGDNGNDNYILLDDNNILHFYGVKNLETFTIVAGDLYQGYLNDKTYIFHINNSVAYNNIASSSNQYFDLSILKPKILNANCSLPSIINKGTYFDIYCVINDDIGEQIIEIGNKEPKDINYNTQVINFKKFINKNTLVNINAGKLRLESDENKYYLNFTNSTIINYILGSDISFVLETKINNENKNITCYFYKNITDIQCLLETYGKLDIEHIEISKDPDNDKNSIKGKTLLFNNFVSKEINTFIAGYIEKGKCDDSDNDNYTFYFKNSTSLVNIKYTEFSLLMNIPNHIANCFIFDNFYSEKSYDVKCSVKGDKSCSEDNNTDFTVDSFEPEPIILSDTNILYYLNFSGQSTIEKTYRHYLKGGILSKKSVTKNGDNILYKFNIEDCKFNQALNTTYKFSIKIHLDIYKDNTINTETNATCIIPKDISDLNNTNIILECSFSLNDSSFYDQDGKYDISIIKGDQDIEMDEDHIIYISSLDGLNTITMFGCQINKGDCDTNNKYTYKFSSCIISRDISFDNNFEFSLYTKENEKSTCIIDDKKSIICEINGYSMCGKNNDIVIGDNEAQINYTAYSSYKNFNIVELKKLYTTSLFGGNIEYGNCVSFDFIFNFPNTKLTNALSKEIKFNLTVKEPIEQNSLCTIPANSKEFDLKCVVKGDTDCPIDDATSLRIEEIIDEKKLDLIKPNALYINNFINKNTITLKAGNLTQGQCIGKRNEIYFKDSEFIGEIKGQIQQDALFEVNLTYPSMLKANCIIPKDIITNVKIDLKCYIEGRNRCPMFDYRYIELSKNDSEINGSIISPNFIKFDGFKDQKIYFDNYYIETQIINWECDDDNYNFNLSTKFNVDVQNKEEFNISIITDNEKNNIDYKCTFPAGKSGDTKLIICIMDKDTFLIDNNITLNFSIINLEQNDKYIINQSPNIIFTRKNVYCPYFSIDDDSSISPSINQTDKSLIFSIDLKTSYKNKEIKIYNSTGKEKNQLEFKLTPVKSLKYFIRFLLLEEESNFTSKCDVPKNTNESLKINCVGYDITDTKSEYFEIESDDIIKIGEYETNLEKTKIKNPYKKNDDGDADGDGDSNKNSISTAGKVVLIIFIILIFAAVVLALVYYFCFYRKRNNNSASNSKVSNNNSKSNNNPSKNDEDDNLKQSNQQSNSKQSQQSNSKQSQQSSSKQSQQSESNNNRSSASSKKKNIDEEEKKYEYE